MRNFFNTPINAFLIFVVLAAIIIACTASKPNEETVIPNYDIVYPQTKYLVVKHTNGWDQHVKITSVDFELNGHTYILFLDENRHYERIGIIHHPSCPCNTTHNDIKFK